MANIRIMQSAFEHFYTIKILLASCSTAVPYSQNIAKVVVISNSNIAEWQAVFPLISSGGTLGYISYGYEQLLHPGQAKADGTQPKFFTQETGTSIWHQKRVSKFFAPEAGTRNMASPISLVHFDGQNATWGSNHCDQSLLIKSINSLHCVVSKCLVGLLRLPIHFDRLTLKKDRLTS